MDAILDRLEKIAARLETVEKQLQSGGGSAAPAPSGGSEGESPAAAEFKNLVNTHITAFVQATAKFNDQALTEAVGYLKQAVEAEAALIQVASECKKPTDDKFMGLFKPIVDLGAKIGQVLTKNPKTNYVNHLKTLSEGVNVLAWVTITPTPMVYVKEATGSSQFWSNKILVQYKGKDETQTGWVGHWDSFLKELLPYIKQYHTTGLTWNPRGRDIPSSLPGNFSSSSGSSSSGAAPPPPGPPPPPENLLAAPSFDSDSKAPDMGGVFAQLSKGTDITKGLKKVDKSQMTHKNPELRGKSTVPATLGSKKTTTSTSAKKPVVTKPPVGPKKVGNKWVIENHVDNVSLLISDNVSSKDSIMIYACKGCKLQIKGKINNIFIDSCQKTGVVFDDAISSCDVVNSKSVEIQTTGFVPCFNIDKVDGCQLYLSNACLNSEIVTAKSSEMNVTIPDEKEGILEMPVAEQFKTRIVNKKLVTETMVHE